MTLSASNAERLERILGDLDMAQGGAAEVRADGYLWTRTKTGHVWHRQVRIRGERDQVKAARVWVERYVHRDSQREALKAEGL
jgi:hypothetical protein